MTSMLLAVALLSGVPGAGDAPWKVFYQAPGGFAVQPTDSWIGSGTRSELTPDGLRILDESTQAQSGRMYEYAWRARPGEGLQVEARLKVASASDPWGSCINVADGVSEEDVSFFPDRVRLSYAGVEAPFPAGDGLHTYRVVLKAPSIEVYADGRQILDGAGKFTHPVIAPARNRVAFGASASAATSDTTWALVRFQGGEAAPERRTTAKVPGLRIERGETVSICEGVSYANMFRFANGALQVADRRSTDGGKTWAPASGPWVGSCQLADGEVIGLDYRTHAAAEKGWFSSKLTRFDGQGRALPTLDARLHVPLLTPFVDDDGSVRDGPWCDHSIITLRDGSLLAANSGCFAEDTTPIPSYPAEFHGRKYRGFVTRSTDRGLTWEYLSTVTSDPNLGPEGCNEMSLIRTPAGSILCIYRTGGSAAQPSPMYQSRSDDEGRTWGKPERVADRGVWPNTCVTRDGVVVCTYGRPGAWLTFSLDSGRKWVGHMCFYAGRTTAYNSAAEVSPGRVFVMYDRQEFDASGNMASGVVGTYFTIGRTGAAKP